MSKRLDIFDYDDTLMYTPTFAEYMQSDKDGVIDLGISGDGVDNKSQLRKSRHIFSIVFGKDVLFQVKGDFIIVVDARSGRSLPGAQVGIIQDKIDDIIANTPANEFTQRLGARRGEMKDFPGTFIEKSGYLAIKEIRGFHKDDMTIGSRVNEKIGPIYKAVKNKMIVTGRDESLKKAIDMTLRWAQLEFPNKGLYCFPGKGKSSIPQWKAKVILEEIERGQYDEVHFYEDKANWLKATEDQVRLDFPDVNFFGHHVRNIRDSRTI
jgi:hypothetical protein